MSNHATLLLVDVQQGIDQIANGRNNPAAEDNIAALLSAWRANNRHVVHVRHSSQESGSPLRPDTPGFAYKKCAVPVAGEMQVTKSVNSAFIGTDLQQYLNDQSVSSLVIVGLTTDHCVSTTVRMAANLGFEVTLVADATATFPRQGPDGKHHSAETMHSINLASLNGEFCRVLTTADVLSGVTGL